MFEKKQGNITKIGNVILAGSDFDREILGMYLQDGLLDIMKSFTIYMSGSDKALGMSKFLFQRQRLGQIGKDDLIKPAALEFFEKNKNLVIVDVTNAASADTGNGHAYFRKSPWVSSDLLMTFMYDLPPEGRGLVAREDTPIWTFPEDYIEQLRTRLIEYLPELQQ